MAGRDVGSCGDKVAHNLAVVVTAPRHHGSRARHVNEGHAGDAADGREALKAEWPDTDGFAAGNRGHSLRDIIHFDG